VHVSESDRDGELGELDYHLFNEGQHAHLYRKLGARPATVRGVEGTRFAVWAPNAERVGVIGDWNGWAEPAYWLDKHEGSGIWRGFAPGVRPGSLYKYRIFSRHGGYVVDKTDPFALYRETPPDTAGVVWSLQR
jgi:1,4-alpha-glucan branching enzyme